MAVAESPVHDVEVVDVLLADMVAGKPGEVEPVADLPFDVGHVAAFTMPESPLVPVAAASGDIADGPVQDAIHRFHIAGLIAALRAGDDGEVMAVGFLEGGEDHPDAGAVHADRLL